MTSTDFNAFKKALNAGAVEFTYTKKDGSERTAKGTKNEAIVTEDGGSMGNGNGVVNDNVTRYYDLDKNAWRSFCNENFVSYVA